MTTSDGTVLGRTQIFGSAPPSSAFTVVLLADGFQDSEQDAFNTACDEFVQAITTTDPFSQAANAINVFRVNVTSTDSGADDPIAAGGTGATARTYFDATFGGNDIRRLLICDDTTALLTAAAQVPEFSVVLVVVNSLIYGGSGGSIGTYSLATGATEIAVHEMGHTAFGLADEYPYYAGGSETGQDHHPPFEPTEPNVTVNVDRATLKWRDAVLGSTALPTMSNPDCSTVDSRPSPVPAGTVGAFEGAHYFHCGAYRPEYDCKMRNLGVPFCAVCRAVITRRVDPSATSLLGDALYSGSKCYFFHGDRYLRVTRGDTGPGTVDPGYPRLISAGWGWPGGFGSGGIDAALYSGSKCYFFAGDQYIRVTRGDTGPGTVDPGYPKHISVWGWPAGF